MKPLIPNIKRAELTDNPQWFEGKVVMQPLVPSQKDKDIEVIAVWFKNGARTKPHTHSTDQLLVVFKGKAIVANRKERFIIEKGQTILIPSNTWHWHGSATTGTMGHFSIKKPGTANWNPPLYNYLKWKPKAK